MAQTDAPLLLDNNTLANIVGNGDYRFTNLSFDEARAIIDMKGESDVVQTFANPDLEHCIYEYLGIENNRFPSPRPGHGDRPRRSRTCIFTASMCCG